MELLWSFGAQKLSNHLFKEVPKSFWSNLQKVVKQIAFFCAYLRNKQYLLWE